MNQTSFPWPLLFGLPASHWQNADPDSDGVWRDLTLDEVAEGQIWTGRLYRDLSTEEMRDGRTAEPTMALEPGSDSP